MQQRHLIAEISGEPSHHLGRQRDFRHQEHHGFAPVQQLLRQPDIDQRFAAAGNALQQRDAGLSGQRLLQNLLVYLLLLVIQCNGNRLYSILLFRDSVRFLLPQGYRAELHQQLHGLAGRAGKITQIVQRCLAVLSQKRHDLPLAAGGPGHLLQRLLRRYGQLHEQVYSVPHLAAGLRLAAERPHLLHAPQQQCRIVAKGLLQGIRLHGSVLQKAAHRRFLYRQRLRQHILRQMPRLPVAVPHRRREDGVQRVVKRAEIPLPHPQRQPYLPVRHHRLLVQQRTHRFQRLVRYTLAQRQNHRLTGAVAPAEGHQHTAAHLRPHVAGQQIAVHPVDGVGRRLHSRLGDHSHVRYCLPR